MFLSKYRINAIAKKIDRDKTTIIRWENMGLIPKARRDSRGWRFYSGSEVRQIVKIVQGSDYFKTQDKPAETSTLANRISRVGLAVIICYLVYNLFNLNYLGSRQVMAYSNQTTTFYTTVTAGVLDILSASTSDSFTGVNVAFTAQTSTLAKLGAMRIQDARGSGVGWGLNLDCTSWKSGTEQTQIQCEGNGSNGANGKMCMLADSGAIASIAGQDTTSITKGGTDCFGADVSTIDVYTAAATFGKGDYWITDFSLSQYIPANPTSQSLTTTIIVTAS